MVLEHLADLQRVGDMQLQCLGPQQVPEDQGQPLRLLWHGQALVLQHLKDLGRELAEVAAVVWPAPEQARQVLVGERVAKKPSLAGAGAVVRLVVMLLDFSEQRQRARVQPRHKLAP